MLFQNRSEAGRQLAQRLKSYQTENPIIFALPRGGVPVGYEIAKALKAPLEVCVARKVGAPLNPEFGIGAVATGIELLDMDTLHRLGITASEVKDIIQRKQQEVKRCQKLYQQEDLPDIKGRTVIVVDDGVATGVTVQAALQAIQKLNPMKVILAIPVGPQDTLQKLSQCVDELICLERPSSFYAVGAYYHSFPQVSDEEVIQLLEQARNERKA